MNFITIEFGQITIIKILIFEINRYNENLLKRIKFSDVNTQKYSLKL